MNIRIKAGLETLKMLALVTGAVVIGGKTLQFLALNFTQDQLFSGFVTMLACFLVVMIYDTNLSQLRFKQEEAERELRYKEIRAGLEKLKD